MLLYIYIYRNTSRNPVLPGCNMSWEFLGVCTTFDAACEPLGQLRVFCLAHRVWGEICPPLFFTVFCEAVFLPDDGWSRLPKHVCRTEQNWVYKICVVVLLGKVSKQAWSALIKLSLPWFETFIVFWMLYAFFWVIPRRLNFICRRFGTPCLFHLHRQVGMKED